MGTELNWKPGPGWACWAFKNSALWKFQPMLCSASSWDSLFSTGNFLKYYCSLFYIFCCCFLFQLTQTSVSVNFRVCSRLCMPVWLQPANSFAYIPKGRSSYLSPCYLLPLNPRLNECVHLSAWVQNNTKIQASSAGGTLSTKSPSQVWGPVVLTVEQIKPVCSLQSK